MLILIMIILFFAVINDSYEHYSVLESIDIGLLVTVQVILVLDSQYHYATKLNNNMVVSQISPMTSIHNNHIMVIKKVNEG